MATVVNFSASLRTKKTNSASIAKSGVACQEFYSSGTNYVVIICFDGMNLTGKVITGLQLTVTSNQSGYGASSSKTVYLCKSNFQTIYENGEPGINYAGDALGTFSGSFYNNTTTNTITGALLTAMGNYISQGNNTFCIYNPSPSSSSQGYSYNYLQWSNVILTVAYDEAVSVPTTSKSSCDLGTTVTIYTNRATTSTTHTLTYSFGGVTGSIGSNVGASVSWKPPLTLASQIPNAVSGICTITCVSYNGGVQTGSRTVQMTLTVPSSVVPQITNVSISDTNSTVVDKIGSFVKLLSRPLIAITANGVYSSTIASYRTVFDGVTYTDASFITSKVLSAAGTITASVTVTDSRGRTATYSTTITALDYSYPSITQFKCERSNADGTAAQVDGVNVRYSFSGSVAPINNKNGLACILYYKLSSASAWVRAESLPISAYNITAVNVVMEQEFELLSSYDIKVHLQDYFYAIEQSVSIGTKTVIMDFLADGTGIGIGKIAEASGKCEIGWPLELSAPLSVDNGGTGATTAANAIANLGGVKKTGDTMTGNLNVQGYTYPSIKLKPTYESAKIAAAVVEGNFNGIAALEACEDENGNVRRQLEVRTESFQPGLDYAVLLRTNNNGTWGTYRLFHTGMSSPVPVTCGGTGSTTEAGARANLGLTDASILTSGTLSSARLPFKVAYGSGQVSGNSALQIDYSSAGFTQVPYVCASYSTTGSNWSGDNGALKISSKNIAGAAIIVGGSFNNLRNIDWIAIGI